MATVIDKLLVQIGLDSKGLTKGMDATLKQLKESEKATAKIAKNNRKNKKQVIEDSEESADALKEENKQYAILSRSLAGMAKGFVAVAASRKVLSEISDLSNVERVSKFLGMTSTQVGTLQKISENIGDSSQGALNSVADMYNAITGLELEGKNSELFKYFSRVGVSVTDQNGKLKDTRTLLTDIRKGLMGVQDERQRAYLARQMGLGEGLTYLFSKDDKEFNAALDTAEQQGKSVAEVSAKAQKATETAKTALGEAKGALYDMVSGNTDKAAEKASSALEKGKEAVKEKTGEVVDWAKKKMPRNLRNSNPGNIRYGDFAKSHGAIGQDKEGFAIFPDAVTGSKAMTSLLENYIGKQGRNTLRSIINKYAPSTENDTTGYIAKASKMIGIGADEPINPNDKQKISDIAKQMTKIEGSPSAYVESIKPLDKSKKDQMDNYVNSLQSSQYKQQPIQNNGASPITINGDITVNTQATDAKGLVRDLSQQIGRKSALAEGGVH